MSLRVEVERKLGAFSLRASFVAGVGVTALFGRSGSGKTMLVNAIAGLLKPDRGRVEVAGRVLFDGERRIDVPTARRRIGYVFQEGRLFPHFSTDGLICSRRWLFRHADRLAPERFFKYFPEIADGIEFK